jgi:hypothetical protein
LIFLICFFLTFSKLNLPSLHPKAALLIFCIFEVLLLTFDFIFCDKSIASVKVRCLLPDLKIEFSAPHFFLLKLDCRHQFFEPLKSLFQDAL